MMLKHISENFKYPEGTVKEGHVSTVFTIEPNGRINSIVTKGLDSICENEAKRVISMLPKMEPGKHRGNAVRVPYSIPIWFKIQ